MKREMKSPCEGRDVYVRKRTKKILTLHKQSMKCGLSSDGLGCGTLAGFCEYSDEPGSIA